MSDVREALANAISDAVKDDGDLVLKWVSLIEVLDENGERMIWALASEGSTAWDTLGLLQFALQSEQTGSFISHIKLKAEEDDE